ncbi:hypothetical protein DYB31_006701 [Aphanomyces astaci]|uniref:Uncharacterized protein n=2 Tax=Aphanomyces astaci TaxID=112090 RepID=A0A397FD46_APHAT|nr:hypothetical protein DYB31_006701 [Aphanomyces astaci]
MLENLMRALEHDDQAWALDQKRKTVVDIMVKAIKPLGLQKAVQRQLALQRNDPLTCSVSLSGCACIPPAGVEVKVISPEPSVIQPYGQAPALKVDRQVQFKLDSLDTPCGRLALRGLKSWADSSSNAAELLISWAQEVWGVSDVNKPSDCATPNIQVLSAEDAEGERDRRRAVVEAVIQDKLRAAEDEGMTADLLEKLRLLLAKHGDVFRQQIGHADQGGAAAGAHQA